MAHFVPIANILSGHQLDWIGICHSLPRFALLELPEALFDLGWWLFALNLLKNQLFSLLFGRPSLSLCCGCRRAGLLIPWHGTITIKQMGGPATVQDQQAGNDQNYGKWQKGAGTEKTGNL
jgi:hypothetical protein